MKILWITNIMLPPLCEALSLPVPPVGGWMYSSLKKLRRKDCTNTFAVATVWQGASLKRVEVDNVIYYLLPLKGRNKKKYQQSLEPQWSLIKAEFKPDIVHIHGTEFPFGLAYINSCGAAGVVASIQGIISGIARYYASGISRVNVKKCLTFRDFIKQDTIIQQQNEFHARGKLEAELFKRLHHVIGRTDWDKDHALALNPTIRYHYCGETLREEFYKHKWKYSDCKPYSIFVSQAGYPIKGLHMLLKAMPLILDKYPDAKIYVAGADIINIPWYRISGYGRYLKLLIKKLDLSDRIIFTGPLDEHRMCEYYLKSNVFVCPSSIENSPNSLGEAQLLKMPHIASFVGGVPEIVNWNSNILYRFEEYEMLAQKICRIFENKDRFIDISDLSRYDAANNCRQLLGIYKEIYNSKILDRTSL